MKICLHNKAMSSQEGHHRLTVACSTILGVPKVLVNIITSEKQEHTSEHHKAENTMEESNAN